MTKSLVTQDCDSVMLVCKLTYGTTWDRYAGGNPAERDPHGFWHTDRWYVRRLSDARIAYR